MKALALIILLMSQLAFAQGEDFFAPKREGQSFFSLTNKHTRKVLEILDETQLNTGLTKILDRAFNEELETRDVLLFTAQTFPEIINHCRGNSGCEKKLLKAIFHLARLNQKIDDVFLLAITNALDKKTQNDLSLVNYYYKLELTRDLRESKGEDNTVVKENLFNQGKQYHKKEKVYGKLSPRLRLFILYNENEIEILTDVLKSFLYRSFAAESFLVFVDEAGKEERIEISETEQYKAAVKLFNRELNRLHAEGKISGIPLYSDLLALALEVGLISNDMLNEMLLLPEIQDPYTPLWKKVGKVSLRVARTVLVLNPATRIYAMTAFLAIDSIRQAKEENEKVSDDHLF